MRKQLLKDLKFSKYKKKSHEWEESESEGKYQKQYGKKQYPKKRYAAIDTYKAN